MAWDGVLEFENMYKPCKPQLIRFIGNPDYTIKARFWQMLGYELPFDRHDWYVNRCGQEVKYIIDFYSVPGDESAMVVDARPAPNVSGIIDRFKLCAKKVEKQFKSIFS
jgi:cytochrome c heme-lyase